MHEGFDRLSRFAERNEKRVFGQIVGKAPGRLEKERQVVLDTGRSNARAHVGINGALGRVARQHAPPGRAKARAGLFVKGKFVTGQDAHDVHRAGASLRVRIKRADRVDFVVKKIQTQGRSRAHREDVDDAASHGKFARSHRLLDAPVACGHKVGLQALDAHRLPFAEKESVARHKGLGCQTLRGGACGSNQNVGPHGLVGACEVVERLEAFAHKVRMRTHRVVGQRFPVGQARNFERGIEPADFFGQARRVKGVGAHQNSHASRRAPELRERRHRGRSVGSRSGGGFQAPAGGGQFGAFKRVEQYGRGGGHGGVPKEKTR